MESVALLSAIELRELFSETAAYKGMTPAVVEKDFWVCWTLGRIFIHPELSKILVFKGGTSLSKVFHLIERFSEDIDLILDWRIVTNGTDPLDRRTKSKQAELNRTINEDAQAYIAGDLLKIIQELIAPICHCDVDTKNRHTLNVTYPASFSDRYLRPQVQLEIGPLAAWFPCDIYEIQSYAAETFPKIFLQPKCKVHAIGAERTFWEKATILHHEANRPDDKLQPPRYSRHYYDLAMMANSPTKEIALSNVDLLERVVAFKQQFYPRGWANYKLAKPETLKLIPSNSTLASLERDYSQMENMIFGLYPGFDEIIQTLRILEKEINSLS